MVDFVSELEKANNDLRVASSHIQTAFQNASLKSISLGKEKIPDPVDILNRIASIETSIQSLQKECSELNQKRHIAAKNTTSLVLKNYMAIKELSVLVKGQGNSNIHPETEKLANQIKEQNEYWNSQQCIRSNDDTKINDTENSDVMVNSKRQEEEKVDENDQIHPPIIKVYNDSQGSIIVELTDSDFNSVPESIRGQCKIESIKHVAMFIYMEIMNRMDDGYRGKHLYIDRQSITKHTGSVPGLYSIIMNTSLWREIVSTLQFLRFLQVDRDGMMTLFQP